MTYNQLEQTIKIIVDWMPYVVYPFCVFAGIFSLYCTWRLSKDLEKRKDEVGHCQTCKYFEKPDITGEVRCKYFNFPDTKPPWFDGGRFIKEREDLYDFYMERTPIGCKVWKRKDSKLER